MGLRWWGGRRQKRGPGAACSSAGRVARRGGPAPALSPFPVPGRSSLWTVSCCWGGWLVLLRGGDACCAVSGGLQWGGERVVGGVLPRINIGTDV